MHNNNKITIYSTLKTPLKYPTAILENTPSSREKLKKEYKQTHTHTLMHTHTQQRTSGEWSRFECRKEHQNEFNKNTTENEAASEADTDTTTIRKPKTSNTFKLCGAQHVFVVTIERAVHMPLSNKHKRTHTLTKYTERELRVRRDRVKDRIRDTQPETERKRKRVE